MNEISPRRKAATERAMRMYQSYREAEEAKLQAELANRNLKYKPAHWLRRVCLSIWRMIRGRRNRS